MSSVVPVTFAPVSEANFSSPYESCGAFTILEDTIAFEGEERFAVRLLPPLDAEYSYEIEQNATADVIILDNDGKYTSQLAQVENHFYSTLQTCH